jgi:hypothetical protein
MVYVPVYPRVAARTSCEERACLLIWAVIGGVVLPAADAVEAANRSACHMAIAAAEQTITAADAVAF